MKLIFLYGPPAVGKFTVGKELSATTGYKFFHNHLSLDLVTAIFDRGTEQFTRLVRHIRSLMLEEAARADVPGLIMTFVYAPSRREIVQQYEDIVAKHGGEICFVRLYCAPATYWPSAWSTMTADNTARSWPLIHCTRCSTHWSNPSPSIADRESLSLDVGTARCYTGGASDPHPLQTAVRVLCRAPRAAQTLGRHIPENVDHLSRIFGHGHRGGIDLFQRMSKIRRVDDDQRFAPGSGIASVEGGVPLPILFAELDHNDISLFDAVPNADAVDFGGLVIFPEILVLATKNIHAHTIAGAVGCHRAKHGHGQVVLGYPLYDFVAPARYESRRTNRL